MFLFKHFFKCFGLFVSVSVNFFSFTLQKQLEGQQDGSSQELLDLKTKNAELSEQIANMVLTINKLKEKEVRTRVFSHYIWQIFCLLYVHLRILIKIQDN